MLHHSFEPNELYLAQQLQRELYDVLTQIRSAVRETPEQNGTAFHYLWQKIPDRLQQLFQMEEELMIRNLYPDSDLQLGAHHYLLRRFSEEVRRVHHNWESLMRILELLAQWLDTHIRTDDARFLQYLSSMVYRAENAAGPLDQLDQIHPAMPLSAPKYSLDRSMEQEIAGEWERQTRKPR